MSQVPRSTLPALRVLALCLALPIWLAACEGGGGSSSGVPGFDDAVSITVEDGNAGVFAPDEPVVDLGGVPVADLAVRSATMPAGDVPALFFVDAGGTSVTAAVDTDEVAGRIRASQGIVLGDPLERSLVTSGFIELVFPEGYEGERTVRLGTMEPVAEVVLYWPGEDLFESLPFDLADDGSVEMSLPDGHRQFVLGAVREPIS